MLKGIGSESNRSSICGREIQGKFPTNLKQHLKKCHNEVYLELLKKEEELKVKKEKKAEALKRSSLKVSQQMTLVQSLKSKSVYSKDNPQFKLITRKLAIFIGTSNVANSIVENMEFCDLLHAADSRYTVPSRTVIARELEDNI